MKVTGLIVILTLILVIITMVFFSWTIGIYMTIAVVILDILFWRSYDKSNYQKNGKYKKRN
jgi:membrane protein implicated in regulation of membrane protease activity